MKNVKRFSALMLAVMIGLAGCGAGDAAQTASVDSDAIAEEVSEEATSDESQEEEETVTEEVTGSETAEEENEEVSESDKEPDAEQIEEEEEVMVDVNGNDITSVEFAKLMEFGWNLGNTLDANNVGGLESETCWNQPKTTPELIHYVKEVGFTSIRIPISWGNHTDEDYQIDPEWMARVKEVVDYAYDEGLYVIINSHHDNDYYYPSEENYDKAEKFLTTIWTQIAEEFKDYDNHLVFESMNEPRLSGTDIEWWFATSDPKGRAAIGEICKLNQAFVDTVRAGGGNNPTRFILVPSYAANPDFALNNAFSMPVDPVNRIMLSVHAYTPYDFAGNPNGYSEWDGSKNYEFGFMGKLKAMFINEGYGVVIGEFGATNKDNEESRIKWAQGYCQKAAEYGMSYFVWDNGGVGVGEENFGVIDRQNLALSFPDLFEAYMSGYPHN